MLKLNTNGKLIDIFEKCPEKSRCNCFNKNARYICGYVSVCNLINYYKQEVRNISDGYEIEISYLKAKIALSESIFGIHIGDD